VNNDQTPIDCPLCNTALRKKTAEEIEKEKAMREAAENRIAEAA